jgi:membrane protease YdiL (CAAX protease family)
MDTPAERNNGFAMAVAVEGGLAVVALLLAWLFHVTLRDLFPDSTPTLWESIIRGLLATVPMLALFAYLVNAKRPALRELRSQVDWLVQEMFPSGSLLQFAMVAVLAGVGEELLFRGVLQTKLGVWTTPVIGLIVASFLFGLAHALSKLYFSFAIAVGVFLGWLTLHYNDLVAPMVAHTVYDFVALAYISRSAVARRRDANASPSAAAPIEEKNSTADE